MSNGVWSFVTHQTGEPLTIGVVSDRRGAASRRFADFGDLAAFANRHSRACAYGKIVVLADDGIFTFQSTARGDTFPVFCGNSTAAAVSCLGGNEDIETKVHGAGAACGVSAKLAGDAVQQSWIVSASAVRERVWRGRRVVFLSALNDYAIVIGPLPAEIDPETARCELLGPAQSSKLAVIGRCDDASVVEFYNANGQHGAAPQTGLASIALAARSIPWLAEHFADGQLIYPTDSGLRKAALPAVSAAGPGRVAIEMPGTRVSLEPLAMELAT